MKILHTEVVSRHFKHKDNVGTEEGIQAVIDNTAETRSYLTQQGIVLDLETTLSLQHTDQARTEGTAMIIKNQLLPENDISNVKQVSYLNLEPESGPIKDMLSKLNVYYMDDTQVKAGLPADNFVERFQQNQLNGIAFNSFARFYITKLQNILSYISRKKDNTDLGITGIHGGYFFESVLFGLFGDEFPETWKGQIKMGEQCVMQFVEDEVGKGKKYGIKFYYRGQEKIIYMDKIKEKLEDLRSITS